MVLELLHIVFISISYESRSSVASQPCQRMDASLKPAEASGGTEVHEIGNVSQKLYSCDLCMSQEVCPSHEVQQTQKRS